MGVVFVVRAEDGREFAAKLTTTADPEKLVRFERERRLLGIFTTRDGFIPLLDAGVSKHGPYLVMPLVRGGTLRDRLRRGPLGVG